MILQIVYGCIYSAMHFSTVIFYCRDNHSPLSADDISKPHNPVHNFHIGCDQLVEMSELELQEYVLVSVLIIAFLSYMDGLLQFVVW